MRRVWIVSGIAVLGLLGVSPLALHHARSGAAHHRPLTSAASKRSIPGGGALQCPAVPGRKTWIGGKRYAVEGLDTFTKTAPPGSFASVSAQRVVYTGDHGMGWLEYPDGWPSTFSGGAEGYQPSTVLSVHNGALDFNLHTDAKGNPVGANPSPLPGGYRYQTYGAWSFCEKVVFADSNRLADFHEAPLLWPQKSRDWARAESDYPEADLVDAHDFSGFAHYGGSGLQDVFDVRSVETNFNPSRWHVYTQAWGPGFRSYYVDGRLVGTTRIQVWSRPERWQLQIEPSGTSIRGAGHVYVKWVWIGSGPLRGRRG